jgi:hypothetical protein
VYELRNRVALVHYLHKALFSPTKSAMLQAVKDGHLITWPGLTEDAINKHLKLTPATVMGHMNQRRQNIRSTSKAPIEKQPTPDTDLGTKNHLVYSVVVDQGQLYTDLTGKFPVQSSKGNSYVMVCYVYDCNYVKFIPMKSRSASELVKAYDTVHQELTVKGFNPKLQTHERIVDTLEFFPHNYQMPQLSSTDQLLMVAKDMMDALQNPHPEVPFASVGDDTISALADLAAIFKLNPISHASSCASNGLPTPMPC